MTLALSKKVLIPSIVLPVAIAAGIAVYFLNMPAWLLVERIESEPGRNAIEISGSVLSEYPKLEEALNKADESYRPNLPGTTSTMTSYLEGYNILEAIRSNDSVSSEDSDSWIIVENEGKLYSFHVLFQYDVPALG